jgi:murein DD-endopeptidase MepM/ murein hydrolase activator NlpD
MRRRHAAAGHRIHHPFALIALLSLAVLGALIAPGRGAVPRASAPTTPAAANTYLPQIAYPSLHSFRVDGPALAMASRRQLALLTSRTRLRARLAALHRPRASWAAQGFVFPFANPSGVQPPSQWSLDQGVDINMYGDACGSAGILLAATNGIVVQEGIQGFGPTAPVILMSSGPFAGRFLYYGHTGAVFVRVGQRVHAGQPIAEIGCGIVGLSFGPHVEIGMSYPGGAPCCPGFGVTSPEMYRLLVSVDHD